VGTVGAVGADIRSGAGEARVPGGVSESVRTTKGRAGNPAQTP
jgi:hypothetical protein